MAPTRRTDEARAGRRAGRCPCPSAGEPKVVSEAPSRPRTRSRSAARGPAIARMNVAVGVLAVIALVAALYLARAFVVPLLIGILASYALRPVVDGSRRCRVPRPAAAALVLAVLVGSLVLGRILVERRCRGDDRKASRGRAQAAAEPEQPRARAARRRCRTCRKPPTSSRAPPPRPPAKTKAGRTRERGPGTPNLPPGCATTCSRSPRW